MARGGRFVLGLLGCVALAGCGEDGLWGARAALRLEPTEVDFGLTALGDQQRVELTLTNAGRASLRVGTAQSDFAEVSMEGFEPLELASGESRTFELVFTPVVEREGSGVLRLSTDGEPAEGRVSLFGIGVQARVAARGDRVDFGDVEIGTTRDAQLELWNESQARAPFRMALVGDDAPMFSVAKLDQALYLEPGEHRFIPLSFTPYRLAAARATIELEPCIGCQKALVQLDGFGISSIVDVQPLRIDFGRVAPGAKASQTLTITNLGSETLPFDGFAWQNNSGEFELSYPTVGPLGPGQRFVATVTFAPTALGAVRPALIDVKVQARNASGIKVPVLGEGGQPCVVSVPRQLDYGLVPEGMTSTKRVDLLNRCGQVVEIADQTVSTELGGYFGLTNGSQSFSLSPGEIRPLSVSFTPKVGSLDSKGSVTVRALSGSSASYVEVGLIGTSKAFAPCQHLVAPSPLDFGLVAVGTEVTLGLAVQNVGSTQCFLSDLGLAAGSDPEFTATPIGPLLLSPNDKGVLQVQFKPSAEKVYSGLAEGRINHPSNGYFTVPITGKGAIGCFQLQPASVDFGPTRISCGSKSRAVVATNNCLVPITLSAARLAMASSAEISLQSAPGMPLVLTPGGQTQFVVSYLPVDDGLDTAALQVDAGLGGWSSVGVRGMGQTRDTASDRFVQLSQSKVDLLLVIDNSGSMTEEQAGLGANFTALMSAAQAAGVDYHIGITTTGLEPSPGGWSVCPGGVEGGENGRLFPANNSTPRVITPSTPNASAVFANNVKVGWCHWNEQGLEAAYRALSDPLVSGVDDPRTALPNDGNAGFLREDARLAIVFVSDEEDASPEPVTHYVSFFQGLKKNDPGLLSLSAIVAPANLGECPTASSSGTRYLAAAAQTGGSAEKICTQDWASSLKVLSANAFGPKRSFQLSEVPADPSKITVAVDGVPMASGWTYDPGTNSIVFEPSSTPPAGSVIDVTYPLGC